MAPYDRAAVEAAEAAALQVWHQRLAEVCLAGGPAALADVLAEAPDAAGVRGPRTDELLAALPAEQVEEVLRRLAERRAAAPGSGRHHDEVIELVARPRTAQLPPAALEFLLTDLAARHHVGLGWAAQLVEVAGDCPPAVQDGLVALARRSIGYLVHPSDTLRERTAALKKVLAALPAGPLDVGEAWADAALADRSEAWTALLAHAATATSATPSARWETRARALLDAAGPETARDRIVAVLPLVGRPRTIPLRPWTGHEPVGTLDPHNADALRGLLWMLALVPPTPAVARELGRLVAAALKKVPQVGPRSPKIANAGVLVLAAVPGEEPLAQLARLSTTVTFRTTLKLVEAALDEQAEARGLTREDVAELAVPGHGLDEAGRRVERLGDAEAELVVDGTQAVLRWRNAAGKPVKSPPASVRRDHADELKELKAAAKDIGAMLTAQSERIDRQFLLARTWRGEDWLARYLHHPLVGTLARRLLWLVDGVPVGFADGALRGLDDEPVTPGPEARVQLWHPVGRPVAEVLAWRAWLEARGVTQPFKQAHREVYLLTAAEERTRVYSNRFAAHILRQHQFHALAAARGWDNRLRLMVDDVFAPATRELPEWGLRAEFRLEGVGEDYGTDTTSSGAYLYLATDQVRFHRLDAPPPASGGRLRRWLTGASDPAGPVPLHEVPPLVLSEVLRDVDLFVGVASVGNDPTWSDGGPDGRFRAYWHSYGFGELTATARTRADTLERLLPRLAVGKVSTLDGRFLRVQGELRAYRIHLGSGNILMEPDDRYLCIVPAGGGRVDDGVFLPFEGDGVLSTILSKAMLLAKDTAITDPSIVSQLRRLP